MNGLRNLFGRFERYHADGRPMLVYTARLGIVFFPLLYLLRFTKGAPPYDDAVLRAVATLVCAAIALRARWPIALRAAYLPFAYAGLVFCLPFFAIFGALVNHGGTVAMSNTLMATFFLVLLTDWRNTFVMLALGAGSAALAYAWVMPAPLWPVEYMARAPLVLLVVIGGSIFKFAEKQSELHNLQRSYSALAGSIAHEMRNPLGQVEQAFRAMQQVLPLPGMGGAQPLRAHELETLYRQLAQGEVAVRRGLRVIAMTLDEVNAKPMDAARFSYIAAAQATRKAVQDFAYESDADRAKLDLTVRQDFVFRGDETAYLFMLFNLIQNALSHAGGRPHARVSVVVDGPEVSVTDDGPGVPAHGAASLFEPFTAAGRTSGTGLGLAYCRRVMHGFGGEIWHEAAEPRGARFVMRFRRVDEAELQAHRASVLQRSGTAFAGGRVLVLGSDPAWRSAVAASLDFLQARIECRAAEDLPLHMAPVERIDALVVDLDGSDGELCPAALHLRRSPHRVLRELPVVGCSGDPVHLARVKAQRAEVDQLLPKPADALMLAEALLNARCRRFTGLARADNPLAGRTLLLADDSEWSRRAVAAYLVEAGARVVEAGDGAQVLAYFRRGNTCDAVLLDLQMPGVDGLEAARALRRESMAGPALPVLALTGHADGAVRALARAAGIDEVLLKPVDPQLLCRKLGLLLGGAASAPASGDPADLFHEHGAGLVDWGRLDQHRRLGLSAALLSGSVPELLRLMALLEQAYARSDLAEALQALHGLLGVSAESGATSLHEKVRTVYLQMLQASQWPAAADWLGELRVLAARTQTALSTYAEPGAAT
jgi:CheY-like chemotaxis protein/signal transduction histidine kinase